MKRWRRSSVLLLDHEWVSRFHTSQHGIKPELDCNTTTILGTVSTEKLTVVCSG